MVVIQLSDEQVAKIANRANGRAADNKFRRREPTVGDFMRGTDRMTVGEALAGKDSLIMTVLADLRALQVAARTAGRREVESRVVAIIDGIENTIAES